MGCTLTISGEEDEVVRAAVEHAISVHGHEDTQELWDATRASLKDEIMPSAAPVAQPSVGQTPAS
jgi:predicted small metal-binding protein